MKIFYTDIFELPLPAGHRFPMSKYRLLRERVEQSNIRRGCHLLVPEPATDDQLALVHTPRYLHRIAAGELSQLEERRIGFPWSPAMVERSRRSTGATIDAAQAAWRDGIAVNLAGGTHHAFPNSGQGYCVFNDVCVAARVAQQELAVGQVLIIDCDVHQGNGSAAICTGDDSVFTLSLHCEKNYPFRKTEGDLDIALPEGSEDSAYLEQLHAALHAASERCEPEIVFYVSGADPYREDRLGRLNLTKPGLAERDRTVLDWCAQRELPVVVTMAGGYCSTVSDIVDIHYATVELAYRQFAQRVPLVRAAD